jgi:hypothetical protein
MATDLDIRCEAALEGESLQIRYAISSRSQGDVYVLDTLSTGDRVPFVCAQSGEVHLLFGVAPLPPDRNVVVRIIPLGTKLLPSRTLERELALPVPLREQSPYYSPIDPDQADRDRVRSLRLTVHVLRSSVDGFEVEESPVPDAFWMLSKDPASQVESLGCRVAIPELEVLRYKDTFTRI